MTELHILYSGPIVKRDQARIAGSKLYFTGNPCPKGHIAQRRVDNASCSECGRISAYNRSLRPDVKEVNKKNKQKIEYKIKQKEYDLNRLIAKNPNYKPNRKLDIGIPSDNKEYHRIYYHIRRSCDPNFGTVKDKEKRAEYARMWQRDHLRTEEGKATAFMRKCVYRCINNKSDRTKNILGYTKYELIKHIECLFERGMSWDNHGEWHIDHIIPISWFLKYGVNDPKVINKLSNLRPLWASENMSKGGFRGLTSQERVC